MSIVNYFRSLFAGAGTAKSTALPSRSSTYQPLVQDEANATNNPPPPDQQNQDAAAALLLRLGRSPDERISVSPFDDARILRRIDMVLLPLMLSVYFLQALDKATLSYASVFGLIDDTGLVGDQFSWLGSVVFLAQLIMQLPVAYALVKLPIGTFTSAMVLGWGATLALMAWARSFPSLLVARFFLGAFEASIGPSFVAITQMWWRRREQTMRIGSWYCMNGLTWVFGSLITYGLASIHSEMKPYQIIFLFFGLVTVAVSGIMFAWMPDSPTEAKFLTDDDKLIAIERLRDNQMGVMSREWRHDHIIETLRDVKTWLWVAMIFCISVPSNGMSVFGPLIVQSFVSNPFQTILFNVPVGLAHIVAVTASSYLAMKWKLKGPVIALLCVPPMIGFSILLHYPHDLEHRGILLFGYFSLSTFAGISTFSPGLAPSGLVMLTVLAPLIYAWSAQCTAGDTKKKFTSALVFISSSAGNIAGPLLFTPGEGPAYSRGLRANLVFFALIAALVVATTIYLKTLNRQHSQRRVALGKSAHIVDTSMETSEEAERLGQIQMQGDEAGHDPSKGKQFSDMTDLENEDFVFVY